MVSLGVDAVGFNCGTVSLDEYVELAKKFVSEIMASKKSRVVIFTEPNAGKPELVDGRTVYKVSPEDFAAAAEKIHSAGVNILGGCCGTTPEHIRALAEMLKK
jgi:5-methyltetrahydrofolate--homocysteine methyltransferase